MEISTIIEIIYKIEVAQTGYRVCSKKKCKVKYEGSRYTSKNFSMLTVHDFCATLPNIGDKIQTDDVRRLSFYDKWGPLKEENETEDVYLDLAQKFLDIAEANKNKRMPAVRNRPELSWSINQDGLLCPAIECDTLYDALLIAWQLNIHRSNPLLKTCLHYSTYGQRKNCTRTFKPTRSDQKHCCGSCRDIYNQKQTRDGFKAMKKFAEDKKAEQAEIWKDWDKDK